MTQPTRIKMGEVAIEENREIIIARWKEYFRDKLDGDKI